MKEIKQVSVMRIENLQGTPLKVTRHDIDLIRKILLDQLQALRFNMESLKGKTVLLHPNLVRPNPEKIPASSTDPRVLYALVETCQELGASRVQVGENPGFCFPARKAFEAAGLIEPLTKLGAEILFFDEGEWQMVEVPSARLFRSIRYAKPILEADIVINVPKWKTHMLTGVSLSIKNLLGAIHDDQRMLYHRNDIIDKIVDLSQVRIPDINVIDGLWAMEGQAPFHGEAVTDFGCLAVSTDMTAADIVASRMMGFEEREIPHLVLAQKQLWRNKAHEIEVSGNARDFYRRFKRPVLSSAGCFPVNCIECGVCNGCLSAIRHSLDKLDFENEWDSVPESTVVSGRPMPNRHTLETWQGRLILFGNCAAEFQLYDASKRAQADWIPGCPPHVLDLEKHLKSRKTLG